MNTILINECTANNNVSYCTKRDHTNEIYGSVWQPTSKVQGNKTLVYKPVKFQKSINTNYDNYCGDNVSSKIQDNFSNKLNLPKIQNPTITLLRNARAMKNESNINNTSINFNQLPKSNLKKLLTSSATNLSTNMDFNERPSHWYKRMYNSLHRTPKQDEFVKVNYTQNYDSYNGYLSEPEVNNLKETRKLNYSLWDLNQFNTNKEINANKENSILPKNNLKNDTFTNVQPGRIENYTPGSSSISEREKKDWWNEVFNIFDCNETLNMIEDDRQKERDLSKPKQNQSNLYNILNQNRPNVIMKKIKETNSNKSTIYENKKSIYKTVQNGGDIPLEGLRKSNSHTETKIQVYPITNSLNRLHILHYSTNNNNYQKYNQSDSLQMNDSKNHKEKNKTFAKALYDFNAENSFELSLKKNERIEILKQVDTNWLCGKIGNRTGIFPKSYIEILKEKHLFLPKSFKVLFKYKPQNEDELELHEGEIIYVIESCDDGWFIGYSQNTGQFGTFPGNYVEEINNL